METIKNNVKPLSKYRFGKQDENQINMFIITEDGHLFKKKHDDEIIDEILPQFDIDRKGKEITFIGNNKDPETFIKKVQVFDPEKTILVFVFENEKGTQFRCTMGRESIERTLDFVSRYHRKYPNYSLFQLACIDD